MKTIPAKTSHLRAVVLAGVSVGLLTTSLFWGGGMDAYTVFFTNTFKSAPPYVNLFLKPLTLLGWPLSYSFLCALTVITALLAIEQFHANWFLVLMSMPFIWELWSGQIDWMPVAGILLGLAIINKRTSIYLYGLAALLLFAKVWVGIGPAVYLTFILLKTNRIQKFIVPVLTLCAVFIVLFFFYGSHWIIDYLQNTRSESGYLLTLSDINGALPYGIGLLSWIFVPFGSKDRLAVIKRITAASLLSMPYLRFYHLIIMIVLIPDNITGIIVFLTGWLGFVLPGGKQLAWLVPAEVIFIDFIRGKFSLGAKVEKQEQTTSN